MDLDLLRSTVDPMFTAHVKAEPLPGLAYGLVLGDELVHSAGLGTLRLGDEVAPDADSVFRIASMTKSFTAAAVLLLRDEGLLRLDDPVVGFVPELAGPAADPRVTIRSLLTMTAGFPTDDPWGDRQQSLSREGFDAFLRSQPWLAWRPGDAYEYSNLGYALLGRVVEAATGRPYREVVASRLLVPLGLAGTVFTPDEVPAHRLAAGYVRRGDAWVEEPIAGYGAFAPMGGLLSSVRDLAAWVAGFLAAEAGEPDGHPLHPDSRREMQRSARLVDADVTVPSLDAAPEIRVRGYGFGLVEEYHPEGRTVSHSGGYPGFGSHMRWHPESGLGIVALGNRTYAPMTRLATEALRAAVRVVAPDRQRMTVPVGARVWEARGVATRLLEAWDDRLVEEWFAENMAADEPLEHRREWFAEVRRRHGRLRPEDGPATPGTPPCTPSVQSWWLAGERGGRVRVDLMLSPHPRPLIQWLAVTSVPEPAAELRRWALGALAERVTHPMWTSASLGPVTAGDGTSQATFAVVGGPYDAEVSVATGSAAGDAQVTWRLLPLRADIR